MKLRDYLKLGFRGIAAQKRRAVMIVVTVGALMSVLVAGCLVIQGVENEALAEMTQMVKGKILLGVKVDTEACREQCDITTEREEISKKVQEYGGEIIGTEMIAGADGVFYRVDDMEGVEVLEEAPTVLVSMSTAARWLGVEMYAPAMRIEDRVKLAERIRSEAVGRTVETENGGRYFVADLLPGGAFDGTLRVSNAQDYNPLDLVLGVVETGSGQSLVVGGEVEGESVSVVIAEFAKIEDAEKFYQDEENYCMELDRVNSKCGEKYRYSVTSLVSEPLALRENMREVWRVYGVVSVILMMVALAIEISTYVRLVQQDAKTIALYHAMGATRRQIRGIYGVYLLVLSLLVVGFAIVVGWILAVAVSVVNAEALTQAFVLGFGAEARRIWLIGWNAWILGMVGVILMAALVVIVCCRGCLARK